jgi:cytidylate kinase
MTIITISRGSYSHGRLIAENVAHRLGYDCISREILLEASKDYHIPELTLFHAIQAAPTLLDHMFFRKEKYIAYIQSALLNNIKKDNVVYHGFAGHFFVRDIGHVLRIRIIADMEERVKFVMRRKMFACVEDAIKAINKIDEKRNKWSQQLYGIDTTDPGLYDMVINIGRLTPEDAVDIICDKARHQKFQKTPESQQKIEDLCLAAKAKTVIVDRFPSSEVGSKKGVVYVRVKTDLSQEEKVSQEVKGILNQFDEIKEVRVGVIPIET